MAIGVLKHHRMVGDSRGQRVVGGEPFYMTGGWRQPFALMPTTALHHDARSERARSGGHAINQFAETAGAGEVH